MTTLLATLCAAILLLVTSPVYADSYSSNFTSGTDGWVLYTSSGGPFTPTWNSAGYIGAPTQYNTTTDNGDGTTTTTTTTYVFENTAWKNFAPLYGGTIEFDALAIPIANPSVTPVFRDSTTGQVVLDVPGQSGLRSLNGKLVIENPIIGDWFHCKIDILNENFDQGPTGSYGTITEVLEIGGLDITGLVITANFLNVLETVYIDNVRVNPVPEPATILFFGIGLIGLAGYGRKKLN